MSVYAVDRYGRLSDAATMTFTLKRARSMFLSHIEKFPVLAKMLAYSVFSNLL